MWGLAMYLQSGYNGGSHSPSLPLFPSTLLSRSLFSHSWYDMIVLFAPQVIRCTHQGAVWWVFSQAGVEGEEGRKQWMMEHAGEKSGRCVWGGTSKNRGKQKQRECACWICMFFFWMSVCCSDAHLAAPGPLWWVPSTNMLLFPLAGWRRDEQHRRYQVSLYLHLSHSLCSAHIFQRSIITPPRSPCLLPLSSFPPTLPLCLSTLTQSLCLTLPVFPSASAAAAAAAAVGVSWCWWWQQLWRWWWWWWWWGGHVWGFSEL